jgi:hypothetical protein
MTTVSISASRRAGLDLRAVAGALRRGAVRLFEPSNRYYADAAAFRETLDGVDGERRREEALRWSARQARAV